MGNYFEELEKAFMDPNRDSIGAITLDNVSRALPFTWGDDGINAKFGLLDWNQFVIIAGEGGSGKTTFTLQQALANADLGYKVCYMSLEMGSQNLVESIAKKTAGIKMQTKVGEYVEIYPNQQIVFKREVDRLTNNKNFNIVGYINSLNTETFIKNLDKFSKEYDIVYIDNLGMIGRSDNLKEAELTPKITEAIMNARKANKCTIVLLHHLTKGSEKNQGPRGKAAIRGSGKILDDADKACIITRDGNDNTTTLSMVKDRQEGIINSIKMYYDKGKFSIDIFD